MRAIVLISVLCAGYAAGYPQQAIDPAYLRQYYQQIAQQGGPQEQGRPEATPIYEQGAQEQQHIPQYAQGQAQQIRLRDNVQDQIQRQYQQPQPTHQYQQQYQPQAQYVQEQQYAQPKPAVKLSKPRPAQQYQSVAQGGQKLENEEDYDPSPSYQFGFDVKDDEFTNYQNRKEQRDGNVIKGSYSVVDSDGFIRTVTYTADPKEGFKAEVSRQPTDIVVKIPKPQPEYQQQHQQQQPQVQQVQLRTQQPQQKQRQEYIQYQ
ncbi:probable basic-leucine zipper transcription factor I [Toxorhynchites rutilus septentrionalis]|uniref:probable basic-leucine zipper transcription factor I n=1 Tax=Toxorhynchites rutilus septentrionalis TaxID=329112 RepID=UPI002479BCD4|nr:probable basic-leucine zipper transcription factor I [Toxorhynchites rutilus septentrionalis]